MHNTYQWDPQPIGEGLIRVRVRVLGGILGQ